MSDFEADASTGDDIYNDVFDMFVNEDAYDDTPSTEGYNAQHGHMNGGSTTSTSPLSSESTPPSSVSTEGDNAQSGHMDVGVTTSTSPLSSESTSPSSPLSEDGYALALVLRDDSSTARRLLASRGTPPSSPPTEEDNAQCGQMPAGNTTSTLLSFESTPPSSPPSEEINAQCGQMGADSSSPKILSPAQSAYLLSVVRNPGDYSSPSVVAGAGNSTSAHSAPQEEQQAAMAGPSSDPYRSQELQPAAPVIETAEAKLVAVLQRRLAQDEDKRPSKRARYASPAPLPAVPAPVPAPPAPVSAPPAFPLAAPTPLMAALTQALAPPAPLPAPLAPSAPLFLPAPTGTYTAVKPFHQRNDNAANRQGQRPHWAQARKHHHRADDGFPDEQLEGECKHDCALRSIFPVTWATWGRQLFLVRKKGAKEGTVDEMDVHVNGFFGDALPREWRVLGEIDPISMAIDKKSKTVHCWDP